MQELWEGSGPFRGIEYPTSRIVTGPSPLENRITGRSRVRRGWCVVLVAGSEGEFAGEFPTRR
jgi:hypothetical protein